MDIEVLAQIITTVGFPIVGCGALFWYINKLTESHKEESKAMQESISQNTTVLAELKELISILVKGAKNE